MSRLEACRGATKRGRPIRDQPPPRHRPDLRRTGRVSLVGLLPPTRALLEPYDPSPSLGSALLNADEVHATRNVPTVAIEPVPFDLAGTDAADWLNRLGLLKGRPVTVGRPHELVELWNLIDREARDVAEHSHAMCEMLV